MKKLIMVLYCSLLTGLCATAQDLTKQGNDTEASNSFWTGNFPGGQILVPISKIAAIAQHKYLLDGQFTVYEVTIDVVGNSLTRIYYIEPVAATVAGATSFGTAAKERAKAVGENVREKTGTSDLDPETIVSKNYPTTTHAHTIEYRVKTLDELNTVYRSLSNALQRGKGRVYSHH